MLCAQEGSSRCHQGTTLQDHRSVRARRAALPLPPSPSLPLAHADRARLILASTDMSTSKTGKHGHAKVHLIATDVRTSLSLLGQREDGKEGDDCQLARFSGHSPAPSLRLLACLH